MEFFLSLLATVQASDELPEVLWTFALGAFYLGSLIACVVLVTALVARRRLSWLLPTTYAALILGIAALAFATCIYIMDHQATEIDGTKASAPIWRELAIPSFPVFASLVALLLHQKRSHLP